MTDTTPRCGSNSEARKRAQEKASTPDHRDALVRQGTFGGWYVITKWHREGDTLVADEKHNISPWMAEHDAQVRRETAEQIAQAVWTHADHMAGYTLPALSSGFIEGYTHALNLLRRDAGFIARQSVEGGGEDA